MIKIVVLLVLTLCFACDAASFVPFSTQKSLSKTFLGAKVNKNRKKGKPASKTGGGFGGAAVAQSNKKVRSISGFAGSGTKPLREAANNFDSLLKKHGKDAVSDVYVRSPLNDKDLLWFVGKIVRCLDENLLDGSTVPTENDAVISQKRLILEYAKRELRPQNLGGPFSEGLELWLAPGDSEMDCVQNKVSLTKVTGSLAGLSEGFSVMDVGYNPEIYVGDEAREGGLRIVRDEEGHPVKDVFEINESM